MKRIVLLCSLVLLSAAAIVSANGEEGIWTGELMDIGCYMGHDGRGGHHKPCATTCLTEGQPMGLLTEDGTLFLLAADHTTARPYEKLKQMAGDQVEISGTVYEKNGVKTITVMTAKPMAVTATESG